MPTPRLTTAMRETKASSQSPPEGTMATPGALVQGVVIQALGRQYVISVNGQIVKPTSVGTDAPIQVGDVVNLVKGQTGWTLISPAN